jgi:flagellar assembly protein FliH
MPEIIQTVQARLGQLSNLRIEIVPEIQHPGIILESENGLIDGSLEGVFQNIDKIFEQVVNHE